MNLIAIAYIGFLVGTISTTMVILPKVPVATRPGILKTVAMVSTLTYLCAFVGSLSAHISSGGGDWPIDIATSLTLACMCGLVLAALEEAFWLKG